MMRAYCLIGWVSTLRHWTRWLVFGGGSFCSHSNNLCHSGFREKREGELFLRLNSYFLAAWIVLYGLKTEARKAAAGGGELSQGAGELCGVYFSCSSCYKDLWVISYFKYFNFLFKSNLKVCFLFLRFFYLFLSVMDIMEIMQLLRR